MSDDYSMPATRFAVDISVGKAANEWGMEVFEVQATACLLVHWLYVIGDARR